jgi:hypothetical protein
VLEQGAFQELIASPQSLLARMMMGRQQEPDGTLAVRPLPRDRSFHDSVE